MDENLDTVVTIRTSRRALAKAIHEAMKQRGTESGYVDAQLATDVLVDATFNMHDLAEAVINILSSRVN